MTQLRLNYQTIEFGTTDIHICSLRDRQQFNDTDGKAEQLGICSASWPIFGVVWPSSIVLANVMSDFDLEGKRILEVGCGLALTSLLLNKKEADITATDHHPEVHKFLDRNTQLNGDRSIAFKRTGWDDVSGSMGLFDVIIGSDLLYEDQHIELLANFIQANAKAHCEVILVDPGRGRKNKITKLMIGFGYSCEHQQKQVSDYQDLGFKGHVMRFMR